MIPVTVADGQEITLTPGVHSELIKQIITEFAPRFAPGSEVIYVGDTGEKVGYFQENRLAELGVTVDQHGKMPDVVLYFTDKDWLLLIESVTSHGPVDAKRHNELAALFKGADPGLVYVTASKIAASWAVFGRHFLGNRSVVRGCANPPNPLQWRAFPRPLREGQSVTVRSRARS